MQVATTKMDPRIAKIHYSDYRKRVAEHRTQRAEMAELDRLEGGKKYREAREKLLAMEKEDRQLLAAYKALRKGHMILHLPNVLAKSGLNANKLPNLAAARADRKFCHLEVSNSVVKFVASDSREQTWGAKAADIIERGRDDFTTPQLTDWSWRNTHGYPRLSASVSVIPAVPAHLRPNDLESGKYTILWEAVWESKAPDDPMLLQRVDKSDYYVVLAQWDLTPLEQQVLQGRFS